MAVQTSYRTQSDIQRLEKLRKLGADISRVSFDDVPPIAKAN